MFTELEELLDSSLEMGIPGYDVRVFYKNEEIYRNIKGLASVEEKTPLTDKTEYNLYSCTKLITVTCAFMLIEKGLLSLDDELEKFYPEFKEMSVLNSDGSLRKAKTKITIKHLLSMSAGFSYDCFSPSLELFKKETDGVCKTIDFPKYLAKEPLLFEPGAQFKYSLCHDVLGALIEKVSGVRLGEFAKKNIFEPLDMKSTRYVYTEENYDKIAEQYAYNEQTKEYENITKKIRKYKLGSEFESGGAGIASNVDDYIKFMLGFINYKLLKKETVDLLSTNVFSKEQLEIQEPSEGYGYGLGTQCSKDYNGEKTDFGWGSAAGAHYFFDKKDDFFVFYMQHVLSAPNMDVRHAITEVASKCARNYIKSQGI